MIISKKAALLGSLVLAATTVHAKDSLLSPQKETPNHLSNAREHFRQGFTELGKGLIPSRIQVHEIPDGLKNTLSNRETYSQLLSWTLVATAFCAKTNWPLIPQRIKPNAKKLLTTTIAARFLDEYNRVGAQENDPLLFKRVRKAFSELTTQAKIANGAALFFILDVIDVCK